MCDVKPSLDLNHKHKCGMNNYCTRFICKPQNNNIIPITLSSVEHTTFKSFIHKQVSLFLFSNYLSQTAKDIIEQKIITDE